MGIKVVESDYVQSAYLPSEPIKDGALWYLFSPEWRWHLKLMFDPKTPKPPAPRTEETWLVGFVQNVLYSFISIEYHGLDYPISVRWSDRVLDSMASPDYFPFTSNPWRPKSNLSLLYQSAAKIQYGPKGIGESEANTQITMSDHPGISVPALFGTKHLKRVQYLHVFKAWVIAQSPRKEHFALVNSEPYTLISTATFSLPPYKALPGSVIEWHSYPVNGSLRSIPAQEPKKDFKPIRIQAGEGNLKPIYAGQTANQRAAKWFESVGLAPK